MTKRDLDWITRVDTIRRSEIGFTSVETLRSADMHSAEEFDRTVLLCTK